MWKNLKIQNVANNGKTGINRSEKEKILKGSMIEKNLILRRKKEGKRKLKSLNPA